MSKLFYVFIFVIGNLLFIQCNNSNPNNTDKEEIKDSCCAKSDSSKHLETTIQSEITCPECGYKKTEEMPTDVCLIKYTCEKCNAVLHPKEGDCCVFCTYGTHNCPSMQEGS